MDPDLELLPVACSGPLLVSRSGSRGHTQIEKLHLGVTKCNLDQILQNCPCVLYFS